MPPRYDQNVNMPPLRYDPNMSMSGKGSAPGFQGNMQQQQQQQQNQHGMPMGQMGQMGPPYQANHAAASAPMMSAGHHNASNAPMMATGPAKNNFNQTAATVPKSDSHGSAGGHKEKPTAMAATSRHDGKNKHTSKVVIILAAVVVVALGLGLGLGLGLNHGDTSSSDTSSGTTDINNPGSGSPGTGPKLAGTPGDNSTKWTPGAGTPWQIVLQQPISIDTANPSIAPGNVDVFDLDLFANDASSFAALHKLDKRVICYFSAGSYEPYRPDSDDFDDDVLGKVMDGWPDEKWLDIRSDNVKTIMARRIQLASEQGCDAIDPDNVDGFQNDNGFNLTAKDSVTFVKYLSAEAAKYNLAIGLKNAGDIIDDVLDDVDFSVNEQCVEYGECETFAAFIDADKPVFHIEYPDGAPKVDADTVNKICSQSGDAKGTEKFSTVIKTMDLDGWVEYCSGFYDTTASQPLPS